MFKYASPLLSCCALFLLSCSLDSYRIDVQTGANPIDIYEQAVAIAVWPDSAFVPFPPDSMGFLSSPPNVRSPNFVIGDFNGDGSQDMAIAVWNPHTKYEGLALALGGTRSVSMLSKGPDALRNEFRFTLSHMYLELLESGSQLSAAVDSDSLISMRRGEPFKFSKDAVVIGYLAGTAWAVYYSPEGVRAVKIAD